MRIRQLVFFICPLFMPMHLAAADKPRVDANGVPLPTAAIARIGDPPLRVTEGPNVVMPSPDGKTFVTGLHYTIIHDAETGRELYRLEPELGDNSVYRIGWSQSGKRLAVLRFGGVGIQTWDMTTRKPFWHKATKELGLRNIREVRFIAKEQLLAMVDLEWKVQLRDAATGEIKQTWQLDDDRKKHLAAFGEGYKVRHVMLSPSGERWAWLAISPKEGGDSGLLVYETETGKLLHSIKGLPYAAAFDLPDEATAVIHPFRPDNYKGEATYYTVVNIADGRPRFRCEHRGPPPLDYDLDLEDYKRHKVFSYRQYAVVLFRGSLLTRDALGMTRWDARTGKKLDTLDQHFDKMLVSADGSRLLVHIWLSVRVYDDIDKLKNNKHFWTPPGIRWLPDGRIRAYSGGRIHFCDPLTGAMTIERGPIARQRWEEFAHYEGLENDREAWRLKSHRTADGKRVIIGNKDGADLLIRWFDDATGKELGRYRVPLAQTYDTDYGERVRWFDDDGTMFGYITADSRLVRVDCATGKALKPFGIAVPREELKLKDYPAWKYTQAGPQFILAQREHYNSIPGWQEHVLFNHDGEVIRQFYLFENSQWQLRKTRVSPDGRFIAIDAFGISHGRIYETLTSGRFSYLEESVVSSGFDFSADSKQLVTGEYYRPALLIWSLDRMPAGRTDPAPPKTEKEAEALWEMLNEQDPRTAIPVLRALAVSPELAIKLIKERVRAPDAKQIANWIVKLDAEGFAERGAAEKELGSAGEWALGAILNARKKPLSAEHERRLDSLLERLREPKAVVDQSGEIPPQQFGIIPSYMREVRALAVLERIGTPEARKVVEAIAREDNSMLMTRDAKMILARWPEVKNKK